MAETTVLDLAHRAMEASPEDEGARLAFYHRLADAELFLMLDAEPDGMAIAPQVFTLEEGRFALAFDLEERLASFADAPAPYAALPGRVIAAGLAGQGIGLALNLAVAPSAHLLPPEAVDWLAQTLAASPQADAGRPVRFLPPGELPAALIVALEAKLAALGGLAVNAGLAAVCYEDGRHGHLFAFVDAAPGAEAGLAKAVAEALAFSGLDAGELDVTCLPGGAQSTAAFLKVCHPFPMPAATASETLPEPAPAPSEPRIPYLRGYRQDG